MVNKTVSSKYQILSILRSNPFIPISGQLLADEIGISRVAVWKAVQTLQHSGYGIKSQGRGQSSGYVLEQDIPDSLFPWEFGEMHTEYRHFIETNSTMDEASLLAGHDSKVSIVTAEKQCRGKGRLNHEWIGVPSSLLFTLITRPQLPVAYYNCLCSAAQLALARVLEKMSGRKYFVRWPNDVWSEEGKVSGILTDIRGTGDMLSWVNLGIGVNLLNKPPIPQSDAVFSVNKEKYPGRRTILLEFLNEFKIFERMIYENNSLLVKLWNEKCPDAGKTVSVSGSTDGLSFKGINSRGWAQCENGEFPPGEIRFVK